MATPAQPAITVRIVAQSPGRCELEIIDSPYKLKDDIKFSGPWYGGRDRDDRAKWDSASRSWHVIMRLENGQTPEQARVIASDWINMKGDRIVEATRAKRSEAQKKRHRLANPSAETLARIGANKQYYREHGYLLSAFCMWEDKCPYCKENIYACKNQEIYDRAMHGCFACGHTFLD